MSAISVCCDDVIRVPVTQDDLAERVGSGFADEYERNIFYQEIQKLIGKIANGYTKTIPNQSIEDLIQECFSYLLRSLPRYDKKMSRITTWTYYVCVSTLNRLYKQEKKKWPDLLNVDDACMYEGVDDNINFKLQVKLAICGLFEKFPKQRDILIAMFGNPFVDGYQCPSSVCCSDSARELGVPYNKVYVFYRDKVCPFLISSFGDKFEDAFDVR